MADPPWRYEILRVKNGVHHGKNKMESLNFMSFWQVLNSPRDALGHQFPYITPCI